MYDYCIEREDGTVRVIHVPESVDQPSLNKDEILLIELHTKLQRFLEAPEEKAVDENERREKFLLDFIDSLMAEMPDTNLEYLPLRAQHFIEINRNCD